jgi:hypothetical protein
MHAVRQTCAGKHLVQLIQYNMPLIQYNMPQAHLILWTTPPTMKRRLLPNKARALIQR